MDTAPPKRHHCLPLASPLKPFKLLSFWVSRYLKKPRFSNRFGLKNRIQLLSLGAALFWEVGEKRLMERLVVENGEEYEKFTEMTEEESRGTSSSTETSSSEEKQSCGGSEETWKETAAMGWPMRKKSVSESKVDDEKKTHAVEERKIDKPKHSVSAAMGCSRRRSLPPPSSSALLPRSSPQQL